MAALRRNFGDVSVTGEAAGLQLVWYLPPGVPERHHAWRSSRAASRIGVYSFMSGGAYVARASTLTQRGLILGYAALVAQADRAGHRAALRRHRRCDRRSERRRQRAVRARERAAPSAPSRQQRLPAHRAIWTPVFSVNRL